MRPYVYKADNFPLNHGSIPKLHVQTMHAINQTHSKQDAVGEIQPHPGEGIHISLMNDICPVERTCLRRWAELNRSYFVTKANEQLHTMHEYVRVWPYANKFCCSSNNNIFLLQNTDFGNIPEVIIKSLQNLKMGIFYQICWLPDSPSLFLLKQSLEF